LNQNYNILYSEHLIYGLNMCTCIFLLHQESGDMILVNNPSFYDEGVTESHAECLVAENSQPHPNNVS
jgi:hypothetical protein